MKKEGISPSAIGRTALLAITVTILLAAAPVFAADTVLAKVPFAFKAGAKTLPAGDYKFVIQPDDEVVAVSSTTSPKGPSAAVGIVTRLASQSSIDARVVFDKVNGEYLLSEIWQPEGEGILVHATGGKHAHHVLHGRKK
jgi:hypothetical protein